MKKEAEVKDKMIYAGSVRLLSPWRGCWLVAHLLLYCFDSLEQQKCHQLLPGCFCALRKLHWLTESSEEQHKSWHKQDSRECAAGKSKLLW